MVNAWEVDERWAAPGRLEQVRRFLNTWERRAVERDAVDRLAELAASRRSWQRLLGDIPVPEGRERRELQDLRAALRHIVAQPSEASEVLADWFDRHPVVALVTDTQDRGPVIRFEAGDRSVCGRLLAEVATAIQDGTWSRLRVCPDCRLAFFDRSRNRSRRWCGMYAGENGRSCGSIAKVQRWRARHG